MKPDEFLEHEDERTVSAALARLRDACAEEQASPVTEERLLDEFRRAHAAAGNRAAFALRAQQPHRWRPATSFALAALLLVACGFVIWTVSYSHFTKPTTLPAVVNLKPVKEVPKSAAAVNETKGPLPAVKAASQTAGPASGSRDRRAARRSGERALTAGMGRDAPRPSAGETPTLPSDESVFIPTMVPVGTESDYGLQLVRVELPGRTIRSFGLPVESRQLNRPVKADLIIGPDGLTRAIRFVTY